MKMNKKECQIPNKSKRCYIQARSFLFAAERCGCVEECVESGMPQILIIPEYVNIAFSCELYLKTLLYKESESIKNHKLSELFTQLDIGISNRIALSLNLDIEKINSLLGQYENLFVKMRYQYEKPQENLSVPLQFFYNLTKSLDQIAQEIIDIEPYPSTSVNSDAFYDITSSY